MSQSKLKQAQTTCMLMLFVAVVLALVAPVAVLPSPYAASWVTWLFGILLCTFVVLFIVHSSILRAP
jgi:hypothetical protein